MNNISHLKTNLANLELAFLRGPLIVSCNFPFAPNLRAPLLHVWSFKFMNSSWEIFLAMVVTRSTCSQITHVIDRVLRKCAGLTTVALVIRTENISFKNIGKPGKLLMWPITQVRLVWDRVWSSKESSRHNYWAYLLVDFCHFTLNWWTKQNTSSVS